MPPALTAKMAVPRVKQTRQEHATQNRPHPHKPYSQLAVSGRRWL